jgi:hypothetical protein
LNFRKYIQIGLKIFKSIPMQSLNKFGARKGFHFEFTSLS